MKNCLHLTLLCCLTSASVLVQPGAASAAEGAAERYHAVVPINIRGAKSANFDVVIQPQESVELINFRRSRFNVETYDRYLPEMSEVVGVDVYEYSTANNRTYLFHAKPGVLIWARSYSDLGELYWEDRDTNYFNVYATDSSYTSRIGRDTSLQDEINKQVAEWYRKARDFKLAEAERQQADAIANRELPNPGLIDRELMSQALQAARNRARRQGWKETITGAYFTDADWTIVRNRDTGIQLRREINGVITMKREDGRCSYHLATFTQQFDGNDYRAVTVLGIVPGQLILPCDRVNLP